MTSAFDQRNERSAKCAAWLLSVVVLAALAVLASTTSARAQAPGSSPAAMIDRDYLTFSDSMQLAMDSSWQEQEGLYQAGEGSGPMVNANMLLAHSVAALKGHAGPSRQDVRARRIAARLVASPPFVEQPSSGPPGSLSQAHAPGWVNSMHNAQGSQHLVFDADVVDGLRFAWRARTALELPPDTVEAIVDRISRTTHGAFWRYPMMRLNQVNWYGLMYSATAEVTGDATLLREDFHRRLLDFTQARWPTRARAGNFGAGMRFHYLPHRPANGRLNVDSAEYANIVFSVGSFYEQARASGMPALPPAERRLLREWGRRVLAGYWTHAGYLNWDTGLGFNRWHQTKKIGLAQQALIALAATEALQTEASQGAWAKWIFDRGLHTFGEWTTRAGGVPPPVSFGVNRKPLGFSSARLGVARMQANAGRAIAAGLGAASSSQPPPLYAFDPDIGRLAVTTPAYNTAVVAVNQGAFPYGGVELARLFDSRQEVAANLGGRPPAAFGLTTRSAAGRPLGSTQIGPALRRSQYDAACAAARPMGGGQDGPGPDRPGIRRAVPRVASARRGAPSSARAPDDPPLHALVRRDAVDGARAQPKARQRPLRSRSRLPEHRCRRARHGGPVDGRRVAVAEHPLPLEAVSYFSVRSASSGYVVVPRERPVGATARMVSVTPQWSAPEAGPTLVVTLADARRFTSVSLGARLVPVPDAGAADAVARQLGAR